MSNATLEEFVRGFLSDCHLDTGAVEENDPEFVPYLTEKLNNFIVRLDFPVKFLDWYLNQYLHAMSEFGTHNLTDSQVDFFKALREEVYFQKERDELVYKYWIQNIYKPE